MTEEAPVQTKKIRLMSFGFSNPQPDFGEDDSYVIIDCRSMQDPFQQVPGASGKDPSVQEFLKNDPVFSDLLILGDNAVSEGKTVCFGDGGGKFRSVGMVEILAAQLKANGALENEIEIKHWHLGGGSVFQKMKDYMSADGEDESLDESDTELVSQASSEFAKAAEAFMENRTPATAADYLAAAKEDMEADLDEVIDDIINWLRDESVQQAAAQDNPQE